MPAGIHRLCDTPQIAPLTDSASIMLRRMAAKTGVGRVYSVRFVPPLQIGLFTNLSDLLVERLSPGNRVTRYGREWIIGRTQTEDRVLSGRLGFVAEGAVTEVRDEKAKDFRDETTERGATTTFAISLDRFTAFIQERSDIRINS